MIWENFKAVLLIDSSYDGLRDCDFDLLVDIDNIFEYCSPSEF